MKNDNALDFIELLILIFLAIFIIIILGKRANKIRCYNLPLNDFYNDVKCKEYWNSDE